MEHKKLTLRDNKESMELESEKRVRHLAKELLQKRCDLDRAILAQIDLVVSVVDEISKLFEAPDVAVLSENSFDRHVHLPHSRDGIVDERRDAKSAGSNTVTRLCALFVDQNIQVDTEHTLFLTNLLVLLVEGTTKDIPDARFTRLDK